LIIQETEKKSLDKTLLEIRHF